MRTYTYIGLRGPSGAVVSALSPERKNFTKLTPQLLRFIPKLTPALASQIKTFEPYNSVRVPENPLVEGLKLLVNRTILLHPGKASAETAANRPDRLSQLFPMFEISVSLLSRQLPLGWQINQAGSHFVSPREKDEWLKIEVGERGISAKLEARLPGRNLNLWFKGVNLLSEGRIERWEVRVHIPKIEVVDAIEADAQGFVARS